MPLNKKERMRRALKYEKVDRLPTQINYTADIGRIMAKYFNTTVDALPEILGNHMVRVDLDHPTRLSDDGLVKYDWWGVGFATNEEGYFASVNPLRETQDLESYAWPDPDALGLLDTAKKTIEEKGDTFFITPNFGFALFERAWSLRGFETFFMDMASDPGFTNALLDTITDIQIKLIHRYLDLGVDGGYFGDDYGAQRNMLFSPDMWRQYIKPRLERMFEPFRQRNLPILMHSDGQINEIIPDLVEIGLTTLNPVQPEVLDHTWLEKEFSGNLAFYGGISTQTVLPNGTPQQVENAIEQAIKTLAPQQTGMVVAPSHRMMTDIPLANIQAMLDFFKNM